MKNKKPIAVILIILIIISLAAGLIGYYKSLEKKGEKPTEQNVYNVLLKYYLNDVEQGQMPKNPISLNSTDELSTELNIEKKYAFNTAICTNNVNYTWDEEKWEFKTDNSADTVCKLFFVTTYNEINIKSINSTIGEIENNKVKRGEAFKVTITPNEGYSYEKTTCKNEEVAEWNKEKNELTIKNIYSNTECEASFQLNKYLVELSVKNGTGSTKLIDKEYGSKIEADVAASTGYNNPKITCSNEQKAIWDNGKLTIEKLTNDTLCSIEFTEIPSEQTFIVSMNTGLHGQLATGTTKQSVLSGASVSFSFSTEDGWLLDEPTCSGGTAKKSGNIITIENVKSDVECTANYKQNNE